MRFSVDYKYLICAKGHNDAMQMDIYGFKAKVTRDGKWFIGSIPELHVHDQARTLRELESELKDAVDTVVEFLLEKNHQKEFKSPIIKSLLAKN